jgi:hypothetical protein
LSTAILVAQTEPASAEQADEFNDWYDTVHIPQVISQVPGVTLVRRFIASAIGPDQPSRRYLAIYEIESDAPESVLRELQKAIADGRLDQTDTLRRKPPGVLTLYTAL